MKAYLSEEGKKVWGKIFQDGVVPVLAPTPHRASLEAAGQEQIYMVDWDNLTPDQRGQVINLLAERFKAPVSAVENQILKDGLPLRAKLVSHVTIPARYF